MKYRVVTSRRYRSAFRKIIKSGMCSRAQIESVVVSIAKGETLEARYKDHELKGEWKGYRECHIRPDVLLVYQIQDDVLILLLVDIGSHAQLFE